MGKRGQVRVSEAAAELGTAGSTAHRLLAMLEYHEFARQDDETKGYAAGPALIKAGLFVVDGIDLRSAARPILEQLCKQVGETVHLVLLEGDLVVFIDSVETSMGARRLARRSLHACPLHGVRKGNLGRADTRGAAAAVPRPIARADDLAPG